MTRAEKIEQAARAVCGCGGICEESPDASDAMGAMRAALALPPDEPADARAWGEQVAREAFLAGLGRGADERPCMGDEQRAAFAAALAAAGPPPPSRDVLMRVALAVRDACALAWLDDHVRDHMDVDAFGPHADPDLTAIIGAASEEAEAVREVVEATLVSLDDACAALREFRARAGR